MIHIASSLRRSFSSKAYIGVQASANSMGYEALKRYSDVLLKQNPDVRVSQIYERPPRKPSSPALDENQFFSDTGYHPRYLCAFEIQTKHKALRVNEMAKLIAMQISSQVADYSKLAPIQEKKKGIKNLLPYYRYQPRFPLNFSADLLYYESKIGKVESLTLPSSALDDSNDMLCPVLELNPNLVHPSSKLPYQYTYSKQKKERHQHKAKIQKVAVLRNKGEVLMRSTQNPLILREMHVNLEQHYPFRRVRKEMRFAKTLEIRRTVRETIEAVGRKTPTDIVLFKLSDKYGYQYHSRDYLEMIDMHQRFFDQYVPRKNVITCLEIARPDVLSYILDKGYRVDMLSDPCNGVGGDLAIYKAAKALEVPIIIHAPPKQGRSQYMIKTSPYQNKSIQERAVLYMKHMIFKAKEIGLHDWDIVVDPSGFIGDNFSLAEFQKEIPHTMILSKPLRKQNKKKLEFVEIERWEGNEHFERKRKIIF